MAESMMKALGAPLSGIPEVARACASKDPQALFSAVDECARTVLQQALCTVNRYEPEVERLTRLYSSNPSSYPRSEEHTSELQSLMRISYAVFCLKKKKKKQK